MPAATSARAIRPWAHRAQEISHLLTCDGDERIYLSPATGLNAYGCAPEPWAGGLTFSSTTASPVSSDGFSAACDLVDGLRARVPDKDMAEAADAEIRARLSQLCGLPRNAEMVLAPSGTDAHRIAALVAQAGASTPLAVVTPSPVESGRGVQDALRCAGAQVVSIAVRTDDGAPIAPAEIDAQCADACGAAIRKHGRALLVVFDVSKTGLRAPSLSCATELKRIHGARLTVLVDACQFRVSLPELRAYLDLGALVAVTGSKFLSGPAFSGALIATDRSISAARAARVSPVALEAPGLGVAVRWQAALTEMERLVAVPSQRADSAVLEFAAALRARLARSNLLNTVELPDLCPRSTPSTVFAFTLRRSGAPLGADRVRAVYEHLRRSAHARAAGHLWLGQPVTVGRGPQGPLDALRLSLSARHLAQFGSVPGSCDQTIALADQCLNELERCVVEN